MTGVQVLGGSDAAVPHPCPRLEQLFFRILIQIVPI